MDFAESRIGKVIGITKEASRIEMSAVKIVAKGQGKQGWLGGLGIRFMVPGADSAGGFSLVEHPLKPRMLAAPLHRHSREDEYSYILQGRHVASGIRSGMPAMTMPACWRSSRRPASRSTSRS